LGIQIDPNNDLLVKEIREIKKPWDEYLKKIELEEKARLERDSQRHKLILQRKDLYDVQLNFHFTF